MATRAKNIWIVATLMLAGNSFSGAPIQRHDDFAVDPKWETFSTRIPPAQWPQITQSFGWTNGQIGGVISRSTVPASYALAIPARDLNHKLRTAGKFRVAKNFGNSGVLFGWFNESSRGWRTPNSLVFRLDGNGGGFWVFFEYSTKSGRTGGKGCFEGDRYQTTPTKVFPANGAVHTWSLQFDPNGNENRGEITFTLDGQPWTLPLHESDRTDGAMFNSFGLLNQQLSGNGVEVWFSDLTLDGEVLDLSRDQRTLRWNAARLP